MTLLIQTTYAVNAQDAPYDYDLWRVGMYVAGIIAAIVLVRTMWKKIV